MRFSTVLASLAAVGVAAAQTITHSITVGFNGTLTFTPNNITGVNDGDTLLFTFVSKNHTATQSSFNSPCSPLAGGFNSDFQDVASLANGSTLTSNFTVANASAPLWFYCQQTQPANHCQLGMVFSVNAPATGDHSFDAFQQAAMTPENATNATSSISVASVSASGTSSSSDVSPTLSATSSATSTDSSAASTDSSTAPPDSSSASTASDSASATSTSASLTPSSSSPARLLRANKAGALLGGVGLLALVI
ncbi:hypothetical protein EIP86_004362 [Pleurotus ostreatoroseus]|nr:hypothetical protein EIP86_004362 [Pleurotus ostreatoroseus]